MSARSSDSSTGSWPAGLPPKAALAIWPSTLMSTITQVAARLGEVARRSQARPWPSRSVVGLERIKDESSDDDADFLGEYWHVPRVGARGNSKPDEGARHRADPDLNRDFITLLEAVELLSQAAAVASYPQLSMKTKGEA